MTSTWTPVDQEHCFAIAKSGFYPSEELQCTFHGSLIPLHLGDNVRIKAENGDWVFVCNMFSLQQGLVPKSYLYEPPFEINRYSSNELLRPKRKKALQEVSDVLQEWHTILVDLYLKRSPDFSQNLWNFTELYKRREKMNYKNLTKEGQKDIQKQFATIIDSGNELLGLDVRARNPDGSEVKPTGISVVEYLKKYKKCTGGTFLDLKQNPGSGKKPKSFALSLTVYEILKSLPDHEIKFFLYDGKEQISESAYFCTGEEVKTPFRILFTDLDQADAHRKKLFLAATIIRLGAMEPRDADSNKKDNNKKRTPWQKIRRPGGAAASDITKIVRSIGESKFDDCDFELNYAQFSENDKSLAGTLEKLTASGDRSSKDSNPKTWEIKCKMSVLLGSSFEASQSHFVVVRKMEFPEVILPSDIRNDLYVTLERGEFQKGSKNSDRNVEVSVTLHDNRECVVEEPRIHPGRGMNEVKSTFFSSPVYYHDSKPEWGETFIVSLPNTIQEFSTTHLRFMFKHRSTNETKDKTEKSFGLAFLPLQNSSATAIEDGSHHLAIYKIDQKHYNKDKKIFNNLDLQPLRKNANPKLSTPALSLSAKEYFVVKTRLCSTRFTQDEQISEFLKYNGSSIGSVSSQSPDERYEKFVKLQQVLSTLRNVADMEFTKFLHDIFDKLFKLLGDLVDYPVVHRNVHPAISKQMDCEQEIFLSLIHIFSLIRNERYSSFISVVQYYIENDFSAALIYKKLMTHINVYLFSFEEAPFKEKALDIVNSIGLLFKFVVQSYQIRTRMMIIPGGTEDEISPAADFDNLIQDYFNALMKIVGRRDSRDVELRKLQAAVLNNVPCIIETLCKVQVFPSWKLSGYLIDLLRVVPQGSSLEVAKLRTIQDVVDSYLFLQKDCRTSMLPTLIDNIKTHLPAHGADERRPSVEKHYQASKAWKILGSEPTESDPIIVATPEPTDKDQCIELLGNVISKLHRTDIGPVQDNIAFLVQGLLEPIVNAVASMTSVVNSKQKFITEMVSILLSFFSTMERSHYTMLCDCIKRDLGINQHISGKARLASFMENVLMSLKNLYTFGHFPSRWSDMTLVQNKIILQVLKTLTEVIKAEFSEPFEISPWLSFFRCATAFITQKSLQLEKFSTQKVCKIIKRYGDMRVVAAELVLSMWRGLGASKKIVFLHGKNSLVLPFLEMTLVLEESIRASNIPIFFDMIRCEFDHSRPPQNFKQMESQFIHHLVDLVEHGKGDAEYRDIFEETMTVLCNGDNIGLCRQGLSFVQTVKRFLQLLLEFREVSHEVNPSNRMTCYVNLLKFSREIDQKELYMKYLYKLYVLQKQGDNYTEAAFILGRHSKMLEWVEEPLLAYLKSPLHPSAKTQMEVKEALYGDRIRHLMKSGMFECALELCDELQQLYRDETYEYHQLPDLLRKMAGFYESICRRTTMPVPPYYRVGFYGKGFPTFLHDKEYIFRGKPFQQLMDFESWILQIYPKADMIRTIMPPTEEITESDKQYLQIYAVKPIPAKTSPNRRSSWQSANHVVRQYYFGNDVDTFTFDRPFHMKTEDAVNEFSTLALERRTFITSSVFPDILSWFPVIQSNMHQVRPIENAMEFLENFCTDLRTLILEQYNSMNTTGQYTTINSLQLKLKGVLDPAVQGGIPNYEKAFITKAYLEKNPGDLNNVEKLKECIVAFVPLLRAALEIHQVAGKEFAILHEMLEEQYQEFCEHVGKTYCVHTDMIQDEQLRKAVNKLPKKLLSDGSVDLSGNDFFGETSKTTEPKAQENGMRVSSSLSFRSMATLSSTKSLYYSASTLKLNGSKSNQSVARQESMPSKHASQRRRTIIPGDAKEIHKVHSTVHEDEVLMTPNGGSSGLMPFFGSGSTKELSKSNESVRSHVFVRQDALSNENRHRASQRWSDVSVSSSYLTSVSSPSPPLGNGGAEDDNFLIPPPLPPKRDRKSPDYESGVPPTPPPKPPRSEFHRGPEGHYE